MKGEERREKSHWRLAQCYLLAVVPLALVPSAVRPLEFSEPVLLVFLIASLIFPSIRPLEFALAVHLVILPLAYLNRSRFQH